MKKRIFNKRAEVLAAFALILPIFLLGIAKNLPSNIFWGIFMFLLLAVVVGLSVPEIVSTWLIIVLTVLGIAFLTVGYIVINIYGKIMLLLAFPLETFCVSQLRSCIFRWYVYKSNEASVKRYIRHYDPIVKLQTTYNAKKLYEKIKKILHEKNHLPVWFDLTVISWEHNEQFLQFNQIEYRAILRKIARTLKKSRLINENLYYLENGKFLIVSSTLDASTLKIMNDELRENLNELNFKDYKPAFKIASEHLTLKQIEKYPTFDSIMRHLKRNLETDLVVEYLKEIEL